MSVKSEKSFRVPVGYSGVLLDLVVGYEAFPSEETGVGGDQEARK